jgi:hypothetical protein
MLGMVAGSDDIDRSLAREDLESVFKSIKRAVRALSLSRELVGINPDDKDVSMTLRRLEISLVPNMEEVIYALSKHDAVPRILQYLYYRFKSCPILDAAVLESKASGDDVLDQLGPLGCFHVHTVPLPHKKSKSPALGLSYRCKRGKDLNSDLPP